MVCSNKVARKRLARRHTRNGPCNEWQTHTNVVKLEQNTHQETRIMNEEHTRGTIIVLFLQVIVFIYLFVHIFYYVFNG